MNWDAIGAIAELLGAAGVVASLLYLTVQLRAGNCASAVDAKLKSSQMLNDFMDLLIRSPELNELLQKGRKNLASLTREEYLRFSNISLKAFWFFSAVYFQLQQGTLSEADFFETRAVIRYWLRTQGCKEWWEKLGRDMFGDDFVAFVESEMETLATERSSP